MSHSSERHVVPHDRAALVEARFDGSQRAAVRLLITDDLIAEHRARPLGQHSDGLERVLNYLRRAPQRGKYVIVCTTPHRTWRLAVLAGVSGIPLRYTRETFTSELEAEHGVFLRRIKVLTSAC